MHQNWTAFMFHWGTVSCSSVDVRFWWPTEHRGEAEFLLGSYCEGPWGPWRNQPRLCSCTTLWISVTSPWELKGRVVCLCSRQVGRWTAERLPKFIFSSGFATGLEDKGSQKTQSKKQWEEVVESFSRRCCRVLDRTFGQGQTLQPGPHRIPSNSNVDWIQAASTRSCIIIPYFTAFLLPSFCYRT